MRKKTMAAIAAFALIICVVSVAGLIFPDSAYANTGGYQSQIDEINKNLKKLQDEKKTIEKSIAGARSEKEQEQQKRNHIDQQIRITRDEIEEMQKRIDLLEAEIEFKLSEIEGKQGEIDENYDVFLKRVRIMYMYDDATTLGLILGVDSYTKYLTHTDTISRLAAHDRALLESLSRQKKELEATKAELDLTLKDLQEQRETIEARRSTLNSQLQAINLRIQNVAEMEKAFLADLERNKAKSLAMENELKEVYRRIELSKNPYVGGVMAFPVPGFAKVSSEFGRRFGGKDFHTGIDIAGPNASGKGIYGANVVAANDGTVRFTNWTYRPGSGYGIYIIVDHGGQVTTLYAHLSNISVKVGQQVRRGDTIGQVGSTGWSTGPHLHFEVRHGSTAQNPRPYIFG